MRKKQLSIIEYGMSIWLLSILVVFGCICLFMESIYIKQWDLYIDIKTIGTIMTIFSLVNTFFSICVSYNRNLLDVLMSALASFALFSLIYNMQYAFWYGIIIMLCAIVVCLLITVWLNKTYRKMNTRKILHVLRYVIFAIMLIPMCTAFIFNMWGDKSIKTYVPINADMPMQDESMVKAQIDTLVPLVNGTWSELSSQEKTDILQTVVNIESTYLGCQAMPLVSDTLGGYTSACYMHDKKLIAIDIKQLKDAEPAECVRSIIHEVRHVYQRQMVETINWEKEGSSTLAGLWKIHTWKENFENYTISVEDNAYAKQPVEVDAYEYSREQTPIYFEKIREHSGIQ